MYELFDKIEVLSIPEQIAEQIKKEIFTKKIRPGTKLPPLDLLSEQLGVSKPTAREALQILHKSGLVSIVKGRNGGYFVTECYDDQLSERMYEMITFSLTYNKLERGQLVEIRKMIEIPCAGFAAIRRTEKNIIELNKVMNLLNNSTQFSLHEVLQLDLKFHLTIAECTQNPLAKTLIEAITRSYIETDEYWKDKRGGSVTANAEKIVAAIIKGDAEAAEREMERHLSYFL